MKFSLRIQKVSSSLTLALNALAKSMAKEGRRVIDFTIGEPDFDTPPHIKEAAIKAIKDGFTKYTSSEGILPLREAISKKLEKENNIKYEPDEIIITTGAKDGLYMLFQVILDEGDEVIIPSPYWVSYPEQVKLAGGIPKIIPSSKDFSFPLGEFKKAITEKTKAIIINNPCNPSGAVYIREILKEVAQIALRENILIVSDEIYEKIIYETRHISPASFSPEIKDITVTVNGFSKTYAMTGWRIGYLAGRKKIIKNINKLQSQSVSCPSSISQKAALSALEGTQDIVDKMVGEFKKKRDYIFERLKNSNFFLNKYQAKGTFYLFPSIHLTKKLPTSEEFCMHLLKVSSVATIPGSAFGEEGYVRISYATSMENLKEGMDRIESLMTLKTN